MSDRQARRDNAELIITRGELLEFASDLRIGASELGPGSARDALSVLVDALEKRFGIG